jgi:hypothetical protein
MKTKQQIIIELRHYLIDSGFTYSTEAGDPPILRPMNIDVLLDTSLDYLIGAGYVAPDKATV